MAKEYSIKLGQEVKDKVTGFQGIVVCRVIWLHGCERLSVQPPAKKGAEKLPEANTFDEPQLEIVGDGVMIKPKEKPTYGDESFIPTHH